MRFGVNTFIWSASFTKENLPLLPVLKAAGFDSVEVPLFRPAEFLAAEIRRGAEENGLDVTVCSVLTGGLSMVSDDPSVRARTVAHMRETAMAAAEAGAQIVAGPLYSPVGYMTGVRRTEAEWNRVVETYQAIGDTLTSTGVVIAIEPLNRFETYFLNTTADAVRLCRENPSSKCRHPVRHLSRQYRRKERSGRAPAFSPVPETSAHLRERSRNPGHRARRLAWRLPSRKGHRVRWTTHH